MADVEALNLIRHIQAVNPDWSYSRIGRELGVSHRYVSQVSRGEGTPGKGRAYVDALRNLDAAVTYGLSPRSAVGSSDIQRPAPRVTSTGEAARVRAPKLSSYDSPSNTGFTRSQTESGQRDFLRHAVAADANVRAIVTWKSLDGSTHRTELGGGGKGKHKGEGGWSASKMRSWLRRNGGTKNGLGRWVGADMAAHYEDVLDEIEEIELVYT